jgi:sirohydrochlorin ferrochelatase
MRVARFVTVPVPARRPVSVPARRPALVLTAHGSADPRSAASAYEVAHTIGMMRRDVDVRVAFCEQNSPTLRDVLAQCHRNAVVVPLLLADAYHARIDIPALIADSGAFARQADVLGEDDRLVHVLRQRLAHAGVSPLDPDVGVLVTAVGSSHPQANANTASVGEYLVQQTRWTATTAFATGPHPTLAEAADVLRKRGATRLVIAPWFLAHGRITDRVAEYARAQRILMAAPLGPHRLVAETVLARFDEAIAARAAA